MPHIVAALFKDQAQAEQALQALLTLGIAQSRITALGIDMGREVSSISGFRTLDIPDHSREVLQALPLPQSDRDLFEKGLRRGCGFIAARIDRENLDEAIRTLEMFDPLDLDRNSREWAEEAASRPGGADAGAPLGTGITGGSGAGTTTASILPGMGAMAESADDLGTDDLRAREGTRAARGPSTTTGTGARRSDERADREGVNALAGSGPAPVQAGLLQRQMNRGGRIWVFGAVEDEPL